MKIATFNANSIRARLPILLAWIDQQEVDVLAVQETKVQDSDFPEAQIRDAGYEVVFSGQNSYNGVAIISRYPIHDVRVGFEDGESPDKSRLLEARVGPITVVNTYVPQGREIDHEMFIYKCRWVERLRTYFDERFSKDDPVVWLGDMNVAHDPIDVYNPQDRRNHVCYHENVRKAFTECRNWGFVDVLRKHQPKGGDFTFYDYRSPGAIDKGQGWRIDYILTSQPLANVCTSCEIDLGPRRLDKPSDHTFLAATFDVS